MLIFPRQKLTYLAIPKTGTTAIEAALAPHSGIVFSANPWKHMNFAEYNRKVLPLLPDEFETVCIVRDPDERMQSWFRYLKPRGVVSSFQDMVERLLGGDAIDPEMGLQADFVQDGDRRVTTLIRYGDPGIANFFAHRLDKVVPLFRRNVSKAARIDPLPPDLEARLADYLARDRALYDSIPPLEQPPFPGMHPVQHFMKKMVWTIERVEARVFG